MKILITKVVTGEKNGKPWHLIHAVDSEGQTYAKFVSDSVVKLCHPVPFQFEDSDYTDVEFDPRGNIVAVR